MARLSTPPNSVQCNCGTLLREEEMIVDHYPDNPDAVMPGEPVEYLLCPKCQLAIYIVTYDTTDKSQLPIRSLINMDKAQRQLKETIARSKNRPYC